VAPSPGALREQCDRSAQIAKHQLGVDADDAIVKANELARSDRVRYTARWA